MDANNNPRPTASFYSGDGDRSFTDVPLSDLGPNNEDPIPASTNVDWALFRAKQAQDKKNRITIISLIAMVAFLSATAAVLGALYGIARSQPPQVLTKTTMSTSVVTTTSILPVTETTTTSIPPITTTAIRTRTLPPVTQTTTQNQTEISLVTTILTTTLFFTTVQTTTSLISSTKGAQDGQRCTVNYEYGGEDLHDLNDDYDLLMADALERAAGKGLDLGSEDYLTVAMRSVFECSVTDVLDLVDACKSGYVHDTSGIYCNSMGSYPTHSVTLSTATGTL